MSSVYDVRDLLREHPCLAELFSELPWDGGCRPKSLKGWNSDPAAAQALDDLLLRGRITLASVSRWQIQCPSADAYGSLSGMRSSKSSTRSDVFVLLTEGGLHVVQSGRVRAAVSSQTTRTHLVRIETAVADLQRQHRGHRVNVKITVVELRESSRTVCPSQDRDEAA